MSFLELFQNDSSSQNDLSSDETDMILSDLLEKSSTPLHVNKKYGSSFVFWSGNEGFEDDSSSSHQLNTIHHKIQSVFLNMPYYSDLYIGEFWAPVTINNRRLLSTSGQPFVINELTKETVMYRLHSEKYVYDIDVNKLDQIEGEGDPKIRSGGPANIFLSRLPYVGHLLESESCFGLKFRITIPICFPSQSDCIGVIEITLKDASLLAGYLASDVLKEVHKVDLDIYKLQQHIPYETINSLRQAKDKITHALEIVCKSHNLGLGQVWGAFEDKSHVHLSTYLEGTQRILGLKLTGYHHTVFHLEFYTLKRYNGLCDVFPLERTSKKHVMKTFQDFKPRYISVIRDDDLLLKWEDLNGRYCAFVICLRSLETRDFNYSFEFIWPNYSEDSRCDVFLEAILLTIKRCLPSFKFASGAEIGDQLEVVEVGCYKEGQNTCFKIFQGKQPIVVDNIMSPSKLVTCQTTSKVVPSKGMDNQCSDVICVTNPTQNPKVNQKTAKIFLTREVIEKQFGKTMNEAAHNLKVSLSTLKRKCKDFGISDWPGPNSLKRKANDSCTTQIDTNEANATTQDPLPANINKKIMFIKAENADDMIKFNMPVSQATFASVEKTIGVKFKLCVGTFKLKYLDEDGDWILLTSDEEMNDCIHSLRKSDQILVRLRVLPTQEPISCSCG